MAAVRDETGKRYGQLMVVTPGSTAIEPSPLQRVVRQRMRLERTSIL
jgi:hypothetical protein